MLVRREFLASRITAALTGAVDSASGVSKRLIRSRLLRARSIGSAVSQVLACRFGGCIRSRARLHYSPALGVRDNDVFDDFYVERSGNLYQRACCNQVLLAGRRIPTGVIVNEDEARGVDRKSVV